MDNLNPYATGKSPIFDPCEKCIIKISCSKICISKMMLLANKIIDSHEISKSKKKNLLKKDGNG